MQDDVYQWLVKPCVDEEWAAPAEMPSVEEWISTGKWMRGKAGLGKNTTVKIEGKTIRTRRIKGVDATYNTDEMMTSLLYKVCQEEFHAMEKSEGAKVRPVVKTSAEQFRKMDYLSLIVEDGFKGSMLSTLFLNMKGQDRVDSMLMREDENDSTWKVPLDQSNFDWHQSKHTIAIVMAAMGWKIHQLGKNKGGSFTEATLVSKALWDSLFARPVIIRGCGRTDWTWNNGLPSGLRWTALLDTFLNACSFRVIVSLTERITCRAVSISGFICQGDDVAFSCPNLHDISLIMKMYGDVGYEVNPSKTYISKERTEFLRKSYERGFGITGYNVRSLLAIRFRNPILELPIVKPARLYSRLTLWHLVSIRGAQGTPLGDCFLEDAEQIGVKKHIAAGFTLLTY